METVTLRGEDFKTVHNAVCELRSLVEHMQRSMLKIDELQRVIDQFEIGLRDAYDQDNAAFERKMDLYSEVKEECRFHSIWSIYSVDDLYAQHPYKGAAEVVYKDHWGEGPVTVPVEGDRWIDLWRAADAAIVQSGDEHHVFVEQFRPQGDRLVLSTGS